MRVSRDDAMFLLNPIALYLYLPAGISRDFRNSNRAPLPRERIRACTLCQIECVRTNTRAHSWWSEGHALDYCHPYVRWHTVTLPIN